jgi:septin family protein
MSHLHDKVNVIPVIGKSDACTKEEIQQFKSTVGWIPFSLRLPG